MFGYWADAPRFLARHSLRFPSRQLSAIARPGVWKADAWFAARVQTQCVYGVGKVQYLPRVAT